MTSDLIIIILKVGMLKAVPIFKKFKFLQVT